MCRKVTSLAAGTLTAHNRRMLPTRLAALVILVGAGACYEAQPQQASTFPEHAAWQGPPGGAIDPGWGYEDPQQPGYPAGYADGSYPQGASSDATTEQIPEPSGDPEDPGYVMGDVTDGEIDATLAPYGAWVEDEEYGRVWRPDPTIVGSDFTPYETAGSWVDTDYGWSFSCDYNWGWLPFHYGRWAYLDDSWGWVPDHTWGPAWVDWREGGGYVGWRPRAPDGRRGGEGLVRDHRRGARDEWRYTQTSNLGQPNIHQHVVQVANGDRLTTQVARPPVRGEYRAHAATLMQGRFNARSSAGGGNRGPQRPQWNQGNRPYQQPAFRQQPGRTWNQQPARTWNQQPARTWNQQPRALQQPTWQRHDPQRAYQQPTYRQPQRTYQQPTYQQPAYRQPPMRTYQPPQRAYQPPQRAYQPPQRSYQQPAYQPPQRSYQPPQRSYQAPSRSYSPPSRSYSSPSPSAPSRSSSPAPSRSSSSSGSSSHSSSSHSGGGSHRR
jgi:hypothetical protein